MFQSFDIRVPVVAVMLCAGTGGAALAEDAEEFTRDNLLAVFYHELGHALIDVRNLPIFGQEEDAADVALSC